MSLLPQKKTTYTIPPFNEITMVIFGSPGAGKTKFCDGDKGTLFIATEPGQDFTTAAVVDCQDWNTFKNLITEIEIKRQGIREKRFPLSDCPYLTFTIDIVDNLAEQCKTYICKKKNLSHPPANDYGKTWGEITREWKGQISRLMRLGPVRFITHAAKESIELADNSGILHEVTRFVPTFSGSKAAQYLDGIVGAMGYAFINKQGQHCITFRKEPTNGAKDRTDILTKAGNLPLNWDEVAKAYSAIAAKQNIGIESKWRKRNG
jgi:hypothetical protein